MLDFWLTTYSCPIWGTSVSTDDGYSNGYQLCSTTRWFVLHAGIVDLLQRLLWYEFETKDNTDKSVSQFVLPVEVKSTTKEELKQNFSNNELPVLQ